METAKTSCLNDEFWAAGGISIAEGEGPKSYFLLMVEKSK